MRRWLFLLGVVHAELLLARRQSGREAHSASENVIVRTSLVGTEMMEVLGLPHNLLKVVYAESGLVFGKFASGFSEKSSMDGRDLPAPPVDFLAIRSLVDRKDSRFFEPTPGLDRVAGSHHDESPLDDLAECCESRAAIALVRRTVRKRLDTREVSRLLPYLWESRLFEESIPWSRRRLTEVAPA